MKAPRWIVACEFSGRVREALRRRGINAYSCDLIPSLDGSRFHIRGNVLDYLADGWDGMIAHPTCTRLCNSGVKHLYRERVIDGKKVRRKEFGVDEENWRAMEEGARFFVAFTQTKIPKVMIENPIMHGYARAIIDPYVRPEDGWQRQLVNMWWFGHGETKSTYFWRRGLPELKPTKIIAPDYERFPRKNQKRLVDGSIVQGRGSGYENRVHFESPGIKNGLTRGQRRSVLLPGLAEAIAEQMGGAE